MHSLLVGDKIAKRVGGSVQYGTIIEADKKDVIKIAIVGLGGKPTGSTRNLYRTEAETWETAPKCPCQVLLVRDFPE